MTVAILYISTLVVFVVIDALMLGFVIQPLFARSIGPLLLAEPRVLPAVLFYLGYVAGLVWLVSLPALQSGRPMQALVAGAVVGAMAYGTYELTNYATLTAWTPGMVVVDLAWGTVLTGVSAWAGVSIARAFG